MLAIDIGTRFNFNNPMPCVVTEGEFQNTKKSNIEGRKEKNVSGIVSEKFLEWVQLDS